MRDVSREHALIEEVDTEPAGEQASARDHLESSLKLPETGNPMQLKLKLEIFSRIFRLDCKGTFIVPRSFVFLSLITLPGVPPCVTS